MHASLSDFYYITAQSEPKYQIAPIGAIVVERMLQGKSDYWRGPFAAQELKKKKLILADWSAQNWSVKKIIQVQQALMRLIAEGFELYLWQAKTLVPLSKEGLKCLNEKIMRSNIRNVDPKKIIHIATHEHKLAHNEIKILDYHWVDVLIGNNKPEKPVLRLQALKLDAHYSVKWNLPEGTQREIDHLVLDIFSKAAAVNWKIWCAAYPKARKEVEYKEVILSEKKLLILLEKKTLVVAGLTITLAQLRGIEALHLSNLSVEDAPADNPLEKYLDVIKESLSELHEIVLNLSNTNVAQLKMLLAVCPKLKKLVFNTCKNFIGKNLDCAVASLPELEVLELDHSDINVESLESLLIAAPNLKRLTLSDCNNLSTGVLSGTASLSVLEELDIRQSNISLKSLKALLTVAPNLKRLTLSSCFCLSTGILKCGTASLPVLEELDIRQSNISLKSLKDLLIAAPNLKRLTIEGCNNLSTGHLSGTANFPVLEELEIRWSDLSLKSIEALLTGVPNLKRLTLSSCLSTGILKCGTASLSVLEELSIVRSDFTVESLQALLTAAPNLKILTIEGCNNLSTGILKCGAASLSVLEELSIVRSNFTVESLQALLTAAPNLKRLTIQDCNNLSTRGFKCETASLLMLEELDINCSNLSLESLEALLTGVPNLKRLRLASCKNLSKGVLSGAVNLSTLEELCIAGSDLSVENLQILLAAAPNIKRLILSHCNNLSTGVLSGTASLSVLEELSIVRSDFTVESLQALLTKAPNVKKLRFYDCNNLSTGKLKCETASLLMLEELDINCSNLSLESLEALLTGAPNLKKLTLSGCKNLSKEVLSGAVNLSTLEELSITLSDLSVENLQILLAAAPNIKRLILSHCNNLSTGVLSGTASLPMLEELDIRANNLSLESLEALLTAAPNLKKLTLWNCDNLSTGRLKCGTASLSMLEELDINCSSLNSESLEALLTAAPNIKSFTYVTHPDNKFSCKFEKGYFKGLVHIELGLPLSFESLKMLLEAAPNLKSLAFNGSLLEENTTLITGDFDPKELCSLLTPFMANPEGLLKSTNASTDVVSTSSSEPLIDPKHDYKKYRDFCPDSSIKPFDFKSPLKSQAMLIAKLTRFLILSKKDEADILRIQEGMCLALSFAFLEKPLEEWDLLISKIAAWNGEEETLNAELNKLFNDLDKYWERYYKSERLLTRQYLGDNLPVFLSTRQAAVLENPWHVITIKPKPESTAWYVYDPNFVEGYREVAEEALASTIRDSLGKLISIYINKPLVIPGKILDPAKFIKKGGLLALLKNHNREELLAQLMPVKNYDILTLEGLLLRNIRGIPFWVSCLESIPALATYTESLLKQFMGKNENYERDLLLSIQHLSPEERAAAIRLIQAKAPPRASAVPMLESALALAEFSKKEGLLLLCQSATLDNAILTFLMREISFPPAIFERLFEKNKYGMPAWVLGLNSSNKSVIALTQKLLQQLFHKDKSNFQKQLLASLTELTAKQQEEAMAVGIKCIKIINSDDVETKKIVAEIEPSMYRALYSAQLQTWQKQTSTTIDFMDYASECIFSGVKKRLIECVTLEEVDALHYALKGFCRTYAQPVFYVNSPDDLICSAAVMRLDDKKEGALHPGPGGPLHDFLKKYSRGVIIINYSKFSAEELVQFNSLIDKERQADGTPVPKDMTIIGLYSKPLHKEAPGNDFYSRFDKVEACPVGVKALKAYLPELPVETEVRRSVSAAGPKFINLYHSADWKERLIGQWVSHHGVWRFEEGELIKLLRTSFTKIQIENGLWKNQEFCHFWRELSLTRELTYPGGKIRLASEVTFERREGYDWDSMMPYAHVQEAPKEGVSLTLLNSKTLSHFFRRYQVVAHQLHAGTGFIKAAATASRNIAVYVTETLNEDQWAMLLEECQRQDVSLTIFLAPGINLPAPLAKEKAVKPLPAITAGLPPDTATTAIIHSTDIDATVRKLLHRQPESLVIDCSECGESDLLTRVETSLIANPGEPLRLMFQENDCALLAAIERGQPVILKGRCSAELANALTPLLLEQRAKIFVVSEDTKPFEFLAQQYSDAVSQADKLSFIAARYPDPELLATIKPYVEADEPLIQLEARCRFLMRSPARSSDENWLGLHRLPASAKDPGVFNPGTDTTTSTYNFIQARRVALDAVLATEPYAILVGLSGVGKSTFMIRDFCQANDKLYQGESALTEWARDTTPGKRKILFLDEANLGPEWSAFEGLYNTPPGILIKGQYYSLSKDHKVVFAANPLSYGGERKLSPFFQRHGNAVIFEPLPNEILIERILKPVFAGTFLEPKAELLSAHLLKIYRFLSLCSDKDILISPRELQMMALCTLSYCARADLPEKAEEIAKYFGYHLAKELVPENKRSEFDSLFKPTASFSPTTVLTYENYQLTSSRHDPIFLLEEYLNLREIRSEEGNEAQRYGGLGGLILEGEPGIGKSELIIAHMRAKAYEEGKDFYRIPVSMPILEKEALLLKAFHEGAIVLIDEINSSPMMERLLNDLLMGVTSSGERPHKPGFMLIGTQNPITMSGRRALSSALSRRLTTIKLPNYTLAEVYALLIAKGIRPICAKALAEAYIIQVDYAKEKNLAPVPTLRDVLRVAESVPKVMPVTEAERKPAESLIIAGLAAPQTASEIVALRLTSFVKLLATYEVTAAAYGSFSFLSGLFGVKSDSAEKKQVLYALIDIYSEAGTEGECAKLITTDIMPILRGKLSENSSIAERIIGSARAGIQSEVARLLDDLMLRVEAGTTSGAGRG